MPVHPRDIESCLKSIRAFLLLLYSNLLFVILAAKNPRIFLAPPRSTPYETSLAQAHSQSANGALYTSMGRSPMKSVEAKIEG
jgi:hypothetical protein